MSEQLEKSANELASKISKWESEAGESFTDYFMHDNVADNSWAFWLLGKGFTEHANQIIDEILSGNTCIDQGTLYDVYPEYNDKGEYNHGSWDKNASLWAEFLVSTPFYLDRVIKFFIKQDE
jgi:hypothetical protein